MVFALHMSEIAETGRIHIFAPFIRKCVIEYIAIFSTKAWVKYAACERKELQISFQYHHQNLILKLNPL